LPSATCGARNSSFPSNYEFFSFFLFYCIISFLILWCTIKDSYISLLLPRLSALVIFWFLLYYYPLTTQGLTTRWHPSFSLGSAITRFARWVRLFKKKLLYGYLPSISIDRGVPLSQVYWFLLQNFVMSHSLPLCIVSLIRCAYTLALPTSLPRASSTRRSSFKFSWGLRT